MPPVLHGRANGLRVAAYRAALVVAGGGMVALAPHVGWTVVFSLVAAICLGLLLWARTLPPVERGQPEPMGRSAGTVHSPSSGTKSIDQTLLLDIILLGQLLHLIIKVLLYRILHKLKS